MLADFGCAAQLTKQLSSRSTFRGTLHWLSPEMIKTLTDPSAVYGVPSDIWAFGIFAIELANR